MKYLIYMLLLIPSIAFSQSLREGSVVKVQLDGGHEVTLYPAVDCSQCYYYLPSRFKVSTKKDNTPEVSLVTWKNDSESKTIGAIFHLLIEWDMTAEIQRCVEISLRSQVDSMAVVMGPAILDVEVNHTVIAGDDTLARILQSSIGKEPMVPSTPGSKMAMSFRITEEQIDDFLTYVNDPKKTSTKIQAKYRFFVKTVKGSHGTKAITVNLPFSKVLELIKTEI